MHRLCVIAALATMLATSAQAQSLPQLYTPQPLDREFAAGISYRDAINGSLFLVGTAVVTGVLTGSMIASAVAAVAVAGTFVLVEPSQLDTASKVAVPTMPQLRVDQPRRP